MTTRVGFGAFIDSLLTGELAVEAAECDAEGLDCAQWIVEVHCKHVLLDTAELHYDVVDCNVNTQNNVTSSQIGQTFLVPSNNSTLTFDWHIYISP